MKKIFYIIVFFAILASGYFFLSDKSDKLRSVSMLSKYEKIEINSVDIDNIVNQLNSHKLLFDKDASLSYAKDRKISIRRKTYYLSRSMRADEIFSVISGKKQKKINFDIGMHDTINKFVPKLQNLLNRSDNEFTKLLKDKEFIQELSKDFEFINPSEMIKNDIEYYLEGYFVQGSYKLNINDDAKSIIKTLLKSTEKMYNIYKDKLQEKKMSFHNFASLVSCLVAEAGPYKEQYKDIAGIY